MYMHIGTRVLATIGTSLGSLARISELATEAGVKRPRDEFSPQLTYVVVAIMFASMHVLDSYFLAFHGAPSQCHHNMYLDLVRGKITKPRI